MLTSIKKIFFDAKKKLLFCERFCEKFFSLLKSIDHIIKIIREELFVTLAEINLEDPIFSEFKSCLDAIIGFDALLNIWNLFLKIEVHIFENLFSLGLICFKNI